MSAAVRQALADAANTVEGLNVSPYFRQSTKPGSGLVRFAGLNRPNQFGSLITWQIVVFLSQNIADAEKFIDTKVPQIITTLEERRALRDGLRAEPQQLALDTGTVPVVVIEGIREETP